MKYFNGPSDDDKPLYGGAYNKTNIGQEVHNFHANNGNYYGFFQPGSNKRSKKDWNDVNVGNITGNKKDMQADDVLVVWVAKKFGESGQFITGWYKHATVYRTIYHNIFIEILAKRHNVVIDERKPDYIFCSIFGSGFDYLQYNGVRIFF